MGAHPVKVTGTRLADGRELIYFDDDPAVLSGDVSRELTDHRDLPEPVTESEMRRDPLTGEWITYAAHRNNRTFMPPANENPLAPTTPGNLPSEVPASDYDVVVFENRFPSFSTRIAMPDDPADYPWHVDGEDILPRRPAAARCEVICFTPDSSASFRDLPLSRIRTVIEAWTHRTAALSGIDGVIQVAPFENRGEEIGVTLQHPHGQIYSYPYLPPRTRSILQNARDHRGSTGRDLFDDVLSAEQRAGERILARTENFTVFVPAGAKWPLEIMLVPNRPVGDFTELTEEERAELPDLLKPLYTAVDRFFEGVERTPYIAAWNQAPVQSRLTGDDESLRGEGRLHLQLFSLMRSPNRMKFLAGSESAFGAWISDTTPESVAQRLREVWPDSADREA
ncbi:MAG: galactose-1-phosphate uridylyltransferase [Mycobacteriaceae bacterium]|uniref:galactose-1-phosphate uridylyltransferase n=1 Tax=Corynebacterium sp. TaxID=1720 RepID=UPI003F95D286